MMDAIDKRNQREKIARSIVKRRNIVYISQEELDRKQQEEKQKEKQEAREAAEQLVQQFKDEQNKKRAMEIERLLADQEMLERQLKTGMDATGKKPMDGVTQERVEAILNEKSKELRDIITSRFMEMEQENRPVEVPVPEGDTADGPQGKVDLTKGVDTGAEDGQPDVGAVLEGGQPDLEAGLEEAILEESTLEEMGSVAESVLEEGSILAEDANATEGLEEGLVPEEGDIEG